MSKMFLLPFAAFAVLAAAVAVWPGGPVRSGGSDGGSLPRSVVLGVGDEVELRDGSVLTFVELVEDSRCPADAMCIWQGRAVVAFDLDGEAFKVVLGADSDATATVGGHGRQRREKRDLLSFAGLISSNTQAGGHLGSRGQEIIPCA